MQLTTKYGVGDVVYRKVKAYNDFRHVPCDLCSATGRVAISGASGRKAECPDCRGIGERGVDFPVPMRAEALTIGQVRVVAEGKTDRAVKEVSYMCRETGVGSWTVYREENLFLTAEEALA